jgi:hypothetical protein
MPTYIHAQDCVWFLWVGMFILTTRGVIMKHKSKSDLRKIIYRRWIVDGKGPHREFEERFAKRDSGVIKAMKNCGKLRTAQDIPNEKGDLT